MSRSKAATVLMRLKEIDKKYKIKQDERNVSTESSPEEESYRQRERSSGDFNSNMKSKLDVRMPEARIETIDSNLAKGGGKSATLIAAVQETSSESDTASEIGSRSSSKVAQSETEVPDPINYRRESDSADETIQEDDVAENTNNETVIDETSRIIEEESSTVAELPEIRENSQSEGERSKLDEKIVEEEFKNETNPDAAVEYRNDTFEDVSSSTMISVEEPADSSSKSIRLQNVLETKELGVKQIEISPRGKITSSKSVAESPRDKPIVELVSPKLIENSSECEIGLDKELSEYVKSLDETVGDVTPICLLKSPSPSPLKKQGKKLKKVPKSTKEDSMKKRKNSTADSPSTTNGRGAKSLTNEDVQVNVEQKREKAERSDGKSERLRTSNLVSTEPKRMNSPESSREPSKTSAKVESNNDAIKILRQLNRDTIDAISKRSNVVKNNYAKKSAAQKSRRKSSSKKSVKQPEHRTSLKRNEQPEKNVKTNVSKSTKERRIKKLSRREEKYLRFDSKHMRRLKKQLTALALQQDRNAVQSALYEFEGIKYSSRSRVFDDSTCNVSKSPIIKPLEFPNLSAFTRPDLVNSELKNYCEYRERILAIRQWMKDRYTLYRDYSDLAQLIDAKYVPSTLEEAKKTIRELQRTAIGARRKQFTS